MAINFDALPQEKPAGAIIPKGQYKATIEKAEMKQPKDTSKPPYLNMLFALTDKESGAPVGKLYDMLSESESTYVMYKIGRFLKALELNLGATFELKDLAKLITGKELLVDVMVDEKSEPNRSVVDIFSGEVFYPVNGAATPQTAIDDTPFATDAADPTTPTVEY